MTSYQETRVKLTNTQLKKLKSEVKNKTGVIFRLKRWKNGIWIISNNKKNN